MHPFPVTNGPVLFPCEQKGRRYEAVKWMVVFAIGVCTGLVSNGLWGDGKLGRLRDRRESLVW